MDAALLLFDGLTVLDAVGPYEVLSRVPGLRVRPVAARPGLQSSDSGMLRLEAPEALGDVPSPEVVLVPGGPGYLEAAADAQVLGWLRAAHESSVWTASVCTGSLILGSAGILRGRRAATHWMAMPDLELHGAAPVRERVVVDGKLVTSAGVSAGIDLGLVLAALIAGEETAQMIQLVIQYEPEPPFDAGSPERAPAGMAERLMGRGG